jgi:parallel beta-helix repeat protein
MKKKTSELLLILTLVTALALAPIELILQAEANAIPPPEQLSTEHGYIRNNGAIEPPTLPIQRNGNFYGLTDNILNYTLDVQHDNVVIDGNGFLLSLPAYGEKGDDAQTKGAKPMISISNKTGIIVRNLTFNGYATGIAVRNSSGIIIFQNTLRNGSMGILLTGSFNCSLIGNKLVENSNTGFHIQNSTYLNIAYNTISENNFHGAYVSGVDYSNISRNDIVRNYVQGSPGIGLYLSGVNSFNLIFENNFMNNGVGLNNACFGNWSGTLVYNNYWNNYWHQIEDGSGNDADAVDQSPLAYPVSTALDPALFPLPFHPAPTNASSTPTTTPSPTETPSIEPNSTETEPFQLTSVAVATALVAVAIAVGALVYLKKRKR